MGRVAIDVERLVEGIRGGRLTQLELPFCGTVSARIAVLMLCEHHKCSIAVERCISRQTMKGRIGVAQYCQSGDCAQGLSVLLASGVLQKARCPTCRGCGWVPKERPTTYHGGHNG
jgi:hypothetical protein